MAAVPLNPAQVAMLNAIEVQLEQLFSYGGTDGSTLVLPPLENYTKPMLVGMVDKTVEFKPKIKAPFKAALAAAFTTMSASWTNLSTVGGWSSPTGIDYSVDFAGNVQLRGLVDDNVGGSGATPASYLPAGVRPGRDLVLACGYYDAVGGWFGQTTVRVVASSGAIIPLEGDLDGISLDGIRFRLG